MPQPIKCCEDSSCDAEDEVSCRKDLSVVVDVRLDCVYFLLEANPTILKDVDSIIYCTYTGMLTLYLYIHIFFMIYLVHVIVILCMNKFDVMADFDDFFV